MDEKTQNDIEAKDAFWTFALFALSPSCLVKQSESDFRTR